MIKRNIWKNVKAPLEMHIDARGDITDIFYQADIEHVAIIRSKDGSLRGDHYHKETTQHILITKGSMEYWYKPVGSNEPSQVEVMNLGDMITTEPYEIHALRYNRGDCDFIVFSSGLRGGKDYESDTFRVSPTIIEG
jgi:hypothetical protein